jgi:hypothetical protein
LNRASSSSNTGLTSAWRSRNAVFRSA